jgi:hypothetical protein
LQALDQDFPSVVEHGLALQHGLPYVRKSQEEYEAQMKEKQIKALKRKARQLGLELIEKPSAGSGTAEAPVQG